MLQLRTAVYMRPQTEKLPQNGETPALPTSYT